MKAMILAAGLGTRLQHLTANKPKALVELNGTPLLELLINRLKAFGICEIIINIHHFAEQVSDFIKKKNQFDIHIEISHETQLLNTGGGIKQAAWFFEDGAPFLLHNVDVLTNLNYNLLLEAHQKNKALATLAVRKRDTSRYFLFNEQMHLCGWESVKDNQQKIVRSNEILNRYSFMGIHIISPAIFNKIQQNGAFSIVDTYLELARTETIYGFDAQAFKWIDLGRPEHLKRAEEILNSKFWILDEKMQR